MSTPIVAPGHPFWQFVATVCTWWPGDLVPDARRGVLESAAHLAEQGTWTEELDALAQVPWSARDDEVAELVPAAVRSLGLTWPEAPSHPLHADALLAGADAAVLPVERLALGLERVEDAPADPPFTAFTIDIDDAPINRGDAHGVDPTGTLTPLLGPMPGTVVLQIDNCGCPGCLDREVRVTRVGTLVCWEWVGRLQMRDEVPRGVARCDVFDATAHDAAIRRLLDAPDLQRQHA